MVIRDNNKFMMIFRNINIIRKALLKIKSTVHFKVTIFIIIKPLLSWILFFIVFTLLRAYMYNCVYASERSLWEQMNGDPYVWHNGVTYKYQYDETLIGINKEGKKVQLHEDYTVTYVEEPPEPTPLDIYVEDNESRQLLLSDIMGTSILDTLKLQTYFGQYAGNDILDHIQQQQNNGEDTNQQDDNNSSSSDNDHVINMQLFFEGFINATASCTNETNVVKEALNYIDMNLPKHLISKSGAEIQNDNAPINLFMTKLQSEINPKEETDYITLFNLQAAINTYNVASVLNCLDNEPLLEKVYLQTLENIIKRAHVET